MQQHIFEGTWEELSKHASEFSGRLLRLILIEEDDQHISAATLERPVVEGNFCYGALRGMPEVTDEDFKAAEWHGEDIDV